MDKSLETRKIFNATFPMSKRDIEINEADMSKNSREFRNLEANFFIDNGYIRFDDDSVTSDIDAKVFSDRVMKSIKTNMIGVTDNACEIIEIHDPAVYMDATHNDACEESPKRNILFIGIVRDGNEARTDSTHYDYRYNATIKVKPGSHHIVEAINSVELTEGHDGDELARLTRNFDALTDYEIRLKKGDFIYILPRLVNDAYIHMSGIIKWYALTVNHAHHDSTHNFDGFSNLQLEFNYTPIYHAEQSPDDYDYIDKSLVQEFKELQNRGWGQVISIDPQMFVFRIRSIAQDEFTIMRDPSIYEAMYEIAYYPDMDGRVMHCNYTIYDCFDVRTSGFIARRRNEIITRELYDLCASSGKFRFEPLKIASYIRNISYNQMICSWYPKEIVSEQCDTESFALTNIKSYSVYVMRFKMLDFKNIIRIAMIESWMKELCIRGGFVLADPDSDTPNCEYGYLVVVAESIAYGHTSQSGNLNTFMNRYDSFHWRRVSRFDHRNKDCLYKVDINDYPPDFFVIRHFKLADPVYHKVRSIIEKC